MLLKGSQLRNTRTGELHPGSEPTHNSVGFSKCLMANGQMRVYGCEYESGRFGYFDIETGKKHILYEFPYSGNEPDNGATFMEEGQLSSDDRLVVVLCGNNRDTLFCFDLDVANVVSEIDTHWLTDLDWASVSRVQDYIVIKENRHPAEYFLHTLDFALIGKIEAGTEGAHECFAVDKHGKDCLVTIGVDNIAYVQLDNPGTPIICPAGVGNGSGHLSAPRDFNSWIVVSCGHYSGPPYMAAVEFDNPVATSRFLGVHGVNYNEYKDYNKTPRISAANDGQSFVYGRDDGQSRIVRRA